MAGTIVPFQECQAAAEKYRSDWQIYGGVPMEGVRQDERCRAALEVRVTWPGVGEMIAVTSDFSDSGSFIRVRFEREPAIGTEMLLQLTSLIKDRPAPQLRAEVVRVTPDGIGVRFIHAQSGSVSQPQDDAD